MLDNITCTVCYMKLCYKLHHTKLNNSKKKKKLNDHAQKSLYLWVIDWYSSVVIAESLLFVLFFIPGIFFFLSVIINLGQSFITFAKFSKKLTFLTTWYAHVRFCTCLMFANVVNEWSPFILCFVAVPSRVFKGWKSEVLYCFMAKSC